MRKLLFLGLFIVCVCLVGCSGDTVDEHIGETQPPAGADAHIGEMYQDVINDFERSGFTNVKTEVIDDLVTGWLTKDGEVESVSINGSFEYSVYDWYPIEAEVVIAYHTFPEEYELDEPLDTDENSDSSAADDHEQIETPEATAELEVSFPQETARRVAVVTMTNLSAPDVFTPDGSAYDASKFHSYADLSGFYMSIHADGVWSVVNENTWHVENLKLKMSEGVYVNASLDITFDGNNYAVIGGEIVIAALENLDSNDPNKISVEKVIPGEHSIYLVVPPSLIEENRDNSIVEQQIQEDENHALWVSSQFSLWDGAHGDLEDLIKANLNDEKSYDHIETTYIEVSSEGVKKMANELLADMGYSNRVEIDDLLITTEFSAKNGFDATIKSVAIGIASYSNDSITLVAIE